MFLAYSISGEYIASLRIGVLNCKWFGGRGCYLGSLDDSS